MVETPFYRKRLRAELVERISKNPRYSMRAFAKALGLDPSVLSQILSGRRFISERIAQKISNRLALSPSEVDQFLLSLAESKKIAGLKRMSPKLKKILNEKKTAGGVDPNPTRELSIENFKVIADWYHYAILELTETRTFASSPQWIARQLGIGLHEAQSAIDRLIQLELLENRDGRLRKTERLLEIADQHLSAPALRRRQKQILDKSAFSLEHDPIEERNHSAMTIAINPEMIPEAKKRIQTFMKELTVLLQADSQDRVYELAVNLFPLQIKSENESVSLKEEQ